MAVGVERAFREFRGKRVQVGKELLMFPCRSVVPTVVVLLSVSACSLSGSGGGSGGPEILDYPGVVSGVE